MNHHCYMAKFAFVFSGYLPTTKDISSIITTVGQKEAPKENLFISMTQAAEMERETKPQTNSLPQLPKPLSVQLVPSKSQS